MSEKDTKKGLKRKGTSTNGASAKPGSEAEHGPEFGVLNSKEALKEFLLDLRDRMTEESAPSIHVLAAMNHLLNLPAVYDLLNKENKEIARDLWLRLRQSGMQLRNPPLLFGDEEAAAPQR